METNLLQTRYGLPVIVAVASHAALLLWIPKLDVGGIAPPQPPVVWRPMPPEMLELLRPPPTTVGAASARPRRQNPAPSLDELVPTTATPADFTVPTVERPRAQFVTLERVPTGPIAGDFDGTLDGPGLGGDRAIGYEKLDRTPRAKVQTSPGYPAAMRVSGIDGRVVVEFTVDPAGRVVSATVLSATNREFEEATVRAVMSWRFEPGRRNGRAVPFRMTVPLEFRLEDNS